MAKVQKKRKLDTTSYPEPVSPDSGTKGGPGTGQPTQRLTSKVVPQRLRQKAYDHGLERKQKKAKRDARGRNPDPAAQLQADLDQARSSYLRQMRASGITSPGESQDAQRRMMRRKHSGFAAKSARACLGAVKLGLLPKRMVAKVTVGTAMWALSPKRRSRAGGDRPGVLAAVTDKVKRQERREARIVDKGAVSRQKESERLAKTGEGRESMSGRHRRRLERMDQVERDNRDPFTEHSAALTHVGILQNAHDEMRRPGADQAKVRQQYESALNLLYSDAQADGLDRAAVERNTRVIAGQLMERDPAQAATFAELGHGRLAKSDRQTVRMPGSPETAQLWTGDYDDAYGGTRKSEGAMTPRRPMGPKGHSTAVARTMYGELAGARTPAEFNETMKHYTAGADVRKHPEMAEMTGDPKARARIGRSGAMFASMRADGLTDQQQRVAYMNGLQESVRTVERTHPEKAAEFRRTAGPEWERDTRDLAGRYRASGQKAARERGQRDEPLLVEPDAGSPPESYEDYVSYGEVVDGGASRGGPTLQAVPKQASVDQRSSGQHSAPATHYRNPGPETLQKQASAKSGVRRKSSQVGADLRRLASRDRSRVKTNQVHGGVQGPEYGG